MVDKDPERGPGGASQVLAGDFSLEDAVGGWRGLIEAVVPGLVFVLVYRLAGGWVWPSIAAGVAIVVMVVLRLVRREPATQALGGIIGVAIGAFWAWRSGDARGYFVPGYWLTGALIAGLGLSMLLRWPAVGIVVGLVRGWGSRWRADRAATRAFQYATAVYLGFQAVRLAIQLALYNGGAQADALGTAKLLLGVPYFVLSLAVIWLMVRRVELAQEPEDPPPPPR